MKSISNYTKASLFLEDITDPTVTVKREQGFTVQRFDYECSRKRNTFGLPYGPSLKTTLRLTIKSLPDGHLKSLYKRMAEMTLHLFPLFSMRHSIEMRREVMC